MNQKPITQIYLCETIPNPSSMDVESDEVTKSNMLTHTHRREKTSECPFNLNQALWGFSLWNAPFVRARDCSQSEQDTKLDKTKNVGYLLPLISMTELIYLTSRQTTLSFRLIQIVGGLVGEVREAATAAMDQVDKLPLFRSMGLFHAS